MAIIGIDLGTSNSAAAVLRGGRPIIIPSSEGISLSGKAFPSYVAVTADDQILVGEPARRQAVVNPEGTITGFKRKMGTREQITLRNRTFTPEQLSGFLLQKIKKDAEAYLGEPVDKAVVTVPAYFDDNQRSATKDACRIAGLEVERLVNEPTAASLAYGLDKAGKDLTILVVDLGGGTFDVTVMDFGGGVFSVKSTSGDTQLGGTDMDERLYRELADRFRDDTGCDIGTDIQASRRLREAVEVAKTELSTSTTTSINLPFIASREGQPLHLQRELSRSEMERLLQPVVDRCRASVDQALHDANIGANDIDKLVFVGGPTRMPMVRRFFEELLHRPAEQGVDPMECVACGAAIQAGVLSGEVGDIVLVDVTPLTLGVETLGGVASALIARNTPIPIKRTEMFTTAADMQTAVTVHVYQGERPMAADNTSLGEFNLDGLPPAPRGVPKIEVTFDIDANGILNVSAKDTATGKSQSISISGSTRLSEEEKQRMVNEAERFAEQDKQRQQEAQTLNEADSLAYQAEKMLAEFSDKIDEAQRSRLQSLCNDIKNARQERKLDDLNRLMEELKQALQEVGKQLYGQQAAAGEAQPHPQPEVSGAGGEARPSGSGSRGKVVDADYTEQD